MKQIGFLVLVFALFAMPGFCQDDLDAGYMKKFGNGIILVAQKGFPDRKALDASQFDYRDGKFFIPSGPDGQFNVRAILPKGVTLGSALAALKKEQPQNLKYHKADWCSWKVWSSHEGGQPRPNIRWPTDPTVEPTWSSPTEGFTTLPEDVYGWVAPGAEYEGDFKSAFWSLPPTSVPGQKLYVTFQVCYEYQVPGGQVESKWNSTLRKFENVTSNGMIGYVYSKPLAVATVEYK